MDTREKIAAAESLPALLGAGEWTVIAGFFDPMTTAQAKRIAGHRKRGRKLLVIVLEGEGTLLSAPARAALAAALRSVNAVTIAPESEWRSAIPEGVHAVSEDATAERARTADFVRFIVERQNPAPSPEAAR